MTVDLLDLVEAAYDVDASEADWLGRAVKACGRLFGRGLGAVIYTYEFSGPEPSVRALQFAEGFDPAWLARFLTRMGGAPDLISQAPAEWRRFMHLSAGTARTTPNLDELTRALEEFGGARDAFCINGRDPEGFGVFFAVPRPRTMRLDEARRALYARVAAHFAAGYRLRRQLAGSRLSSSGAEAVLEPGGELVHAEGVARGNEARAVLRLATRRIDRARSRAGRKDTDAATRSWRGLVEGRWTLVDWFEHGGHRYVLAKRNDVRLEQPPPLSERERQVLAFAALAHSNKEIAYELGLSAATVRVLMSRAARKLRATGRKDAIEIFRRLAKPPSL
ncbi:MAG TPA: LuxR C-terminal-related transcriptional regulator [Polyangia bacterium]|nr:LuxR C-terminal-related transcriptional regulator [Polyangia bacterium]